MIIVGFRRMLTKIFMDKMTKKLMNKKADRDENGNLVLRETKASVGLIIAMIVIVIAIIVPIMLADVEIEYKEIGIALAVFCIVMFIFSILNVKAQKIVITKDEIIQCALLNKNHIKFNLINSVEYKENGKQVIIKADEKKIRMSMMLNGFAEFFEILQNKIGKEKCKTVKLEIDALMK